jgi:hypothetical protein
MANNVLQVKRTSTTGRTPNTTASYATNSQYIAAGEFALNMADGILYTSNGSAVITVGANLVNQTITGTLSVTNSTATVLSAVANGNVGIGTASPTAKLQIVGTAANDSVAELKIQGSTGFIDFHNSLSSGAFNGIVSVGDKGIIFSDGTVNTGSFAIAPWFDGISGIKITNTGSVGIGNSAPNATLAVTGTANISGAVTLSNTLNVTGLATTGNLNATTANVTTLSATTSITGAANLALTGVLHTLSGNVNIDSGLLFVDGTNNKIGINDSAPTVALTISANAGAASATFGGGNTFIRITSNGSFSEPAIEFAEQALTATAKIASKNEASGGGSLYFITRAASANSALTTRMRISGTGTLTFSNTYGITVTTPRNLFIDSGGNVGGISSTRSTKININPIDDVNWIYQFEPVTFNYRSRDEEGNLTDTPESELMYGLIAEDVEPINDDFCIYVDGKLSGVHYDRLVSPLIQAVKDLKKIVDEQTIRIAALEAK